MIQRMKVGVITGIVTVCLSLATSLIIVAISYERNVVTLEFTVGQVQELKEQAKEQKHDIALLHSELESLKPFLQKRKW